MHKLWFINRGAPNGMNQGEACFQGRAGDMAGGLDMGNILAQVAGGAVGGGALTGIGGMLANMMKK